MKFSQLPIDAIFRMKTGKTRRYYRKITKDRSRLIASDYCESPGILDFVAVVCPDMDVVEVEFKDRE